MQRYFLGGNSKIGFCSLYQAQLDALDEVIILKGGPGTGKSSTLKMIADIAKSKGLDYELWFCSGDPNSLDGVYIPSMSYAVVDGTAPHATDPKMPIVREKIVNLAECLANGVKSNGKDMEKLISRKNKAYAYAYDHLSIAGVFSMQIDRLIENVDVKRVRGLANEIVYGLDLREKNRKLPEDRFASAITADGVVSYYDHFNQKRVTKIKGNLIAPLLLKEIDRLTHADKRIFNPLCPSKFSGIVVGNDVITIDTGNNRGVSEIDARIFEQYVDVDEMQKALRGKSEHIDVAVGYLDEARKAHLQLEEYYVAVMDFNRLNDLRGTIIRDMLSRG